jgi:hypothetical protein
MKIISKLNIFDGFLKIFKVPNGGQKYLVFEEQNLITNASKQLLLQSIYLPDIVSDPISNLQVGVGGTIDPDGLYPKLEDPLQTSLTIPILAVPVIAVPDLPNLLVTFVADLDQSQGNGSLITEVGMFKESGNIFNIKNHPGIPKTAEFSIHYEWTIKFL